MTEKQILRFPRPRARWTADQPSKAGWVYSSDSQVFTAMAGILRQGTSKNGKHWERWDNSYATFYSMKSGRLRIYQSVREKGTRFFTDITASPHGPRFPERRVDGVAAMNAYRRELMAITGRQIRQPVVSGSEVWIDVQRVALPALNLNPNWRPIQGIPRALQQTSGPDMVRAALGTSRYRKDLVKALGSAQSLEGLMFATALRAIAPVDWLVPLVAWAAEGRRRDAWNANRYRDARPVRDLLARLPERQRRLLIADLPNAEWIGDTLQMSQRLQPNEMPRVYTWRELHDAITPLNRRAMKRMQNGPIPQEGPTKKLDGLKVGDMELRSAKDTHELVAWGDEMHHCIGSYGYQAVAGTSHLLALYSDQKLVANLELDRTGRVRQFYGMFNATPPETIRKPVEAAIMREMSRK